MTCPMCNGDTKIVDSRKNNDYVVRYRKCKDCGYRFATIEVDEDIYNRRMTSQADEKIKDFVAAFKKMLSKLEE